MNVTLKHCIKTQKTPILISYAFVKIMFLTICDVLILIFQLQIDDRTTGDEYYITKRINLIFFLWL